MLRFQPAFEDISPRIADDPHLIRLFRTALFAVKEEDAVLARAVSQAPPEYSAFYASENRGLGSWVFETDIIHSIYKAWLALVPVSWEKRNPEEPGRIELVVYRPDGAGFVPELICEAKWWMDSCDATATALEADFAMMERWTSEVQKRVLIGLWYSNTHALESSSGALAKLREEIRDHVTLGEIEMLYLGAFPTDFASVSCADGDGFFCMAFFRLRGENPGQGSI